jgi:hypothetical protein
MCLGNVGLPENMHCPDGNHGDGCAMQCTYGTVSRAGSTSVDCDAGTWVKSKPEIEMATCEVPCTESPKDLIPNMASTACAAETASGESCTDFACASGYQAGTSYVGAMPVCNNGVWKEADTKLDCNCDGWPRVQTCGNTVDNDLTTNHGTMLTAGSLYLVFVVVLGMSTVSV